MLNHSLARSSQMWTREILDMIASMGIPISSFQEDFKYEFRK